MNRPLPRIFAATVALAIAFAPALRAQTVSTDPVGAITLTLKADSDTHVSVPFHRPVALETQVQTISGNTITINSSANISSNQFVYNSPSQTNTYYLQFTTGSRAGMFYTVTANDASSITIDPNGDAGLAGNVGTGDTFRVIPYWTLNTLFPNGQGLYSTTTLTPKSSILIPAATTPGINLSAAGVYYYYTGSGGPGWLKLGDNVHFHPDVVFAPDSLFIVRHPPSVADTQIVLVGNVPMSAQSIILNNLQSNTPQDNAIALPVPVTVTLGNSGLASVMVSTTTLTPKDELLVFDPTVSAQNKSASAIYYYYTGSGGPGWLKLGDSANFHNNDVIFQPGFGYVLRRAAQPFPGSNVWTFVPPYLAP